MKEEAALFKYELAIVAILKNEAPYIKEWIDYHILAGVNHFYLYDNESTDNVKEVLKIYIDNDIVDYIPFSGQRPQMPAYNEAIQKYKFDCHYIAFIDLDEFIYPHESKSIMELAGEYFNRSPAIAGFSIHWNFFGSSGHKEADYSRGVLERFTKRAPYEHIENKRVKTILNPRCVKLMHGPHNAVYYEGKTAVREDWQQVTLAGVEPPISNRISINHYRNKSKEEFINRHNKNLQGDVYNVYSKNKLEDIQDESWEKTNEGYNEVYDDGILTYKAQRQAHRNSIGGGGGRRNSTDKSKKILCID